MMYFPNKLKYIPYYMRIKYKNLGWKKNCKIKSRHRNLSLHRKSLVQWEMFWEGLSELESKVPETWKNNYQLQEMDCWGKQWVISH